MNRVLAKLKYLHIENERQAQYLNAILENINIGVLVFDETGKVDILNRYARQLLGIGNLTVISKLDVLQANFYNVALNLKAGSKAVLKIVFKDELLPISVIAGEYRFFSKNVRLITFQNIKSELEEKELESWQNLIRVLTHEIMNSIGPMTSTIDTLSELINDNRLQGQSVLNEDITKDIEKGISIIKERSFGIHDFVKRFRSITLLPKLNCQLISIHKLFEHVGILMHEVFEKETIKFSSDVFPYDLSINADKSLIEQILINLVQNAIDEFQNNDNKLIKLKAFQNIEGQVLIEVIDNGPGIENELLDKIFIPFFTTKENGSGIGLSLARQIMRQHNGKIHVHSKPGEKTTFTLVF